jgi:hypothetical protein
MMEAPKQTAAIFDILSRGQFINSNSSDESIRKLYAVLEEEENFTFLYGYFQNVNFTLERGDEYFYFSRKENKIDLERKLEQAFKWIDILDFFKTFNNSFGPGFRFTPSEILVQLGLEAELKSKLEGLKKHSGGKDKFADILDRILEDLRKDKFIDLENEISHQYKALAAFNYIERIVTTINISEEAQNEISE